jgi:hypothetical protein
MIQKKQNNRRQKNRRDNLKNITHEQINDAMAEFINHGGKITHIEKTERSFEEYMAQGGNSGLKDVDEFLGGGA